MLKRIQTGGITWLSPIPGSDGWSWGSDYTSGDLYEAEELYLGEHPIRQNRLIFVHFPDGRVAEPVKAREGQYFGQPCWDDGCLILLLADFPAGELRLLRYDPAGDQLTVLVTLPRSQVEDCYNLMPHPSPLILTRQTGGRFQVLWPERADFPIAPQETFCFREGDRLVFSRWYEDPDYREEAVVRRFPDGAILEQTRGALFTAPDGQPWLLTE